MACADCTAHCGWATYHRGRDSPNSTPASRERILQFRPLPWAAQAGSAARDPRMARSVSVKRPILVTGGAGYIGSVLVRQLLQAGERVRVVDTFRFGGESLLGVLDDDRLEVVRADVCDEEAMRPAIEGCAAVVHLAALVGDPACSREPELARATNLDASKMLYRLAEASGVERFVFASTCSNYGRMDDPEALVDETSELRPVSIYAETKVAVERFLLEQPRSTGCRPTMLRFATVYGLSPRIRFDLTVNEFTRELALGRELVVFGEQFWRPYCHVRDLARSAVLALTAPADAVAFEVFNVGDTAENYRKKDIVETVLAELPDGRISYVHKDEDPRDYRVSFAKIAGLGFRISRTVPDGVREIVRLLAQGLLLDPDDPRYANVPQRPTAALQAAPDGPA